MSFDRKSSKGRKKIADYLASQLKSVGSVAVFSKDLTWVEPGSTAEKVLLDKAGRNELTLFVESEMPLTIRLKGAGAIVKFYGGQRRRGFNPRSRFTVLDVRTSGTSIMIGSPSNGEHVIKHYGQDDHEVLELAKDFISLLECTARSA